MCSTCCLPLLYVIDCTVYIRHTLQTIQHVQLLYMVHCHCEGQMNGCAKIQPVTTHLLLSQLPLPSIGSPTARMEQAVHHHHRLGWNVGDGCVDKGSRHPARGVGPAPPLQPNFVIPNVRRRHRRLGWIRETCSGQELSNPTSASFGKVFCPEENYEKLGKFQENFRKIEESQRKI